MLQRGRAHVSAERNRRCDGVAVAKVASTGPRSRERGETIERRSATKLWLLQRGRAHVSAESTAFKFPADTEEGASTGPRSRERGEYLRFAQQGAGEFASTGPRS